MLMVTQGPPLLQELQRALPTLSPKLGSVARFCIQHASTLHHYRIQDVADACDTMPVSVVRLAQRFGLRGFQELKLAFIDQGEPVTRPDHAACAPPESSAARLDIEASTLGLSCLGERVLQPEFVHVVQALRCAPLIRFDWAGEEDRLIALHLQARLRAAGFWQVDAAARSGTGTGASSLASGAAWLVQIAVWRDIALYPGGFVASDFGAHVLQFARGRMDQPATIGSTGVVVRVGTDARRMLNAFALCEALTTAMHAPAATATVTATAA